MSKFMILYRAPAGAREQMATATPEQQQAGFDAWRAWAAKVDYAISDLGSPLAHNSHVGAGAALADEITGYSILDTGAASSSDEVATILDGHPHLAMPGASIEVLEIIPLEDLV